MHYSKKRNSTTKLHLNKSELIEEIQNEEMNKECFDCGSEKPEYISINNGIFLCKKCIYHHYKFSHKVSTLIKNNLSILGEKELKYLYYGGNKRLSDYIHAKFPDLDQFQQEFLYKSDELEYYRNRLSVIVNKSEISYFTQNNFYHPMTDKRTKKKFVFDSNNNLFNSNDLTRKYNYRRIHINRNRNNNSNEKYICKTDRSVKSIYNTARKQYKKRLVPNRSPNMKDQVESYQNSPILRQNRFFNEQNKDSDLLNNKAFAIYTNDRFDQKDNSGSNTYNNNSCNDDKYMNYNYRRQNINRNYINNKINANSPNNSNFYVNFRTKNNEGSSKSPQIGNNYLGRRRIGYNNNNKLSKYQSFYNRYNYEIPNKLVLASEENNNLISSRRVYSKPKLPKYKTSEEKNKAIKSDEQNLEDIDNNSKRFWIKSRSPKMSGRGWKFLSPQINFNSNKNTPLKLDDFEQKNVIKENGSKHFIYEKNKKNEKMRTNYIINQNSKYLGVKEEENKNKEENRMNLNKNNGRNSQEFISGNESNDNFMINENNSKNKYITAKKKENELDNIKKEEDYDDYLNNEFREKPLDPINVMGKSNETNKQENDEINSNDIINYIFSNMHNVKKINDGSKKIKKRHKRNKKIVNREKGERLKMEIEEKIQKEREDKLKMEEEERKNQFKKKFTKKEILKMMQKERLKMEQEEIRRKKEKEIDDKIIKEESEEDEQDDDEKDLKSKEIERIEEKFEEEEMDLNEKDKEKENKEEKVNENNEKIIGRNEKKEKLNNEKKYIVNNLMKIEEKRIEREDDNKINNKEKKSEKVNNIKGINTIKDEEKEKEKEKNREVIEIKEKIEFDENIIIINKNKPKVFKSYTKNGNDKKIFRNKIRRQVYNINKDSENSSNKKTTNISSENKENNNDVKIYKALDAGETFKNSIRNKYKRKKNIE